MKLSDRIREHALRCHVEPARKAGSARLTIRAGDVCRELGLRNRTPAVCSALRTRQFLERAGLELLERKGPPQSTTTRFHYAFVDNAGNTASGSVPDAGDEGMKTGKAGQESHGADHGREWPGKGARWVPALVFLAIGGIVALVFLGG